MSILNVKTFKSFSYKLNVEELRTNIVKKNLKNAISIYSSFRMETITCTFSLSFISIISNTLSFFSLDFPSVSLPSPRLPREAAHLHETSDILRVVRERKGTRWKGRAYTGLNEKPGGRSVSRSCWPE